MTKSNGLKLSGILVVLGTLLASAAMAAEVDTIYVRAKAGPVIYSNIDPVSSAFGVGLDLGFRTVGGFGIAAMSNMNFLGSGTDSQSTTVSVRTEVKSLFLGVSPGYSVTKGIATLTFGLGIGVLSVTSQSDTFTSGFSGGTSSTPETTRSRFALAPNFVVDFDLGSGWLANVGLQFISTFGESPKPGIISPMGGFGYRF